MKNLYSVLGVSAGATENEIKKAYRALSKKYHPDVNPGNQKAEERFKEVSEAYSILQDPEKRKEYDVSLSRTAEKTASKAARKTGTSAKSSTPDIDFGEIGKQFERFFGFQSTGEKKTNPLDTTDLFEKYMGIRK